MESNPTSPIGEAISQKLTVRPSSSIPQNRTTGNPLRVQAGKRPKVKKALSVAPEVKAKAPRLKVVKVAGPTKVVQPKVHLQFNQKTGSLTVKVGGV